MTEYKTCHVKAIRDSSVFITDVVWKFNTGSSEITCGGWSTQPQQVQSYWDSLQLQGVCQGMGVSRWKPHEPGKEVCSVVTVHRQTESNGHRMKHTSKFCNARQWH